MLYVLQTAAMFGLIVSGRVLRVGLLLLAFDAQSSRMLTRPKPRKTPESKNIREHLQCEVSVAACIRVETDAWMSG